MFLLFQTRKRRKRSVKLHLHSNMFLLFLNNIELDTTMPEFTFQYVSIISNYIAIAPRTFFKFTFQYVSIISHTNSSLFIFKVKIYIPICFYYFPSNVALYNSTTILPSFVDPVIIFCFFNKIFSFFPKLCIFPTKRQLSTPRLFYLIIGRQFSFYMNSPSVSNSSCIISPMPFPVSNSNSYLYVAL